MTFSGKKNEAAPQSKDKTSRYNFKVNESLLNKISIHVKNRKKSDPSFNRQKWISEAVNKKLENETELTDEEIQKKSKQVNYFLSEDHLKKIECLVEKNKKILGSYSKKQWIVESILEKIDREVDTDRQINNALRKKEHEKYSEKYDMIVSFMKKIENEIRNLKKKLQPETDRSPKFEDKNSTSSD